jgi:peptidoglycan lytic transglycosylase D
MRFIKILVIIFIMLIASTTVGIKLNRFSHEVFDLFQDKTFSAKNFQKVKDFNADEDILYLPEMDSISINNSINNLSILRNKEVRKFLYLYLTKNRPYIIRSIERSHHYKDTIADVFKGVEKIPEYITLLPFLESGFCPRAVSRSSAVGLWQFMRGTSSILGLEKNIWVDERRSVKKSTKAAFVHLKNLYNIFKSWDLALAAYNSGSSHILNAMKKSGAKNIWQLIESRSLRKETHEYVPRFMALILIYKYQSEFGLKDQIAIPENIDITEINLKEQVNIYDIARLSDTPVKTIKMLNPELNRLKTPPGKRGYSLKIPESTKSKLLKNNRLYTKFFTSL